MKLFVIHADSNFVISSPETLSRDLECQDAAGALCIDADGGLFSIRLDPAERHPGRPCLVTSAMLVRQDVPDPPLTRRLRDLAERYAEECEQGHHDSFEILGLLKKVMAGEDGPEYPAQ